jgi:hypothetical protein
MAAAPSAHPIAAPASKRFRFIIEPPQDWPSFDRRDSIDAAFDFVMRNLYQVP